MGPSQRVEATLVSKQGPAGFQNAIPPLRELGIVNDSEEEAEKATVSFVLRRAAELLRKSGNNPALDGYSGDPKRAWELASGIWIAVAAMGLYALSPASLEYAGQKVRGLREIGNLK